jgi:hypothetical protein
MRITSRLAGIRGGPQGAVSDVGDPTERLTSLTALRHATTATLYGSQPDADSTQGVSPDMVDSICLAASPPSQQQCLTQSAVSAAGQPARGQIDLVALVAPWVHASTTGDDPWGGVVDHRPGLTSELAGEYHIDARECQQAHVGCLNQMINEFSFNRLNLFHFGDAIVVQVAEQALVQDRVAVGGRRVLGPAHDPEQGAGLDLDPRQACQLSQPCQPRLRDSLRGRITAWYDQGYLCSEHIIKTSYVSGKAEFEVFQELAAEQRALLDQVAAMAGKELQPGVHRVPSGLLKPEAINRRAKDSLQIRGVGLIVVGAGLTEMAGDGGMNDPRLKAGVGVGTLDRPVIGAGLFDGDDEITEVVSGDRLAQLGDGLVETALCVFDDSDWDEDAAVEIGEHHVGTVLGGVNSKDAEVLGADGLNAWSEDSMRFAEVNDLAASTGAAMFGCTHEWVSELELDVHQHPAWKPTGSSRREEKDLFQ